MAESKAKPIDTMTAEDGIMVLTGENAKAFLEYDSSPMTEEEELQLQKAEQYYLDHCD